MRFSLKWLKKFLFISSRNSKKIISILTDIGFDVDSYEYINKRYKNFYVVRIKSIKPHLCNNQLKICTVTDGISNKKVISRAKNLRVGIKVVFAKVGAIIPILSKDVLTNNISNKIKYTRSKGILCNAFELSLSKIKDSLDVVELPNDANIGQSFSSYLGLSDIVYNVALPPNRGDCACVYGIARELGAFRIGILKNIKFNSFIDIFVSSKKISKILFKIEDKKNVIEFFLQYIEGITNVSTKENKFLKSTGYSIKNTIIDISNFMMLTFGRPNTIYDADKIKGRIKIRKSKYGEKFIAVGGIEYILPKGLTVISDDIKIISIAGVVSSELTKVDRNTTNILIEIADFEISTVIKSCRALNLITDSSFRFEHKIDKNITYLFANLMITEILDKCGGVLYKPIIFKSINKNKYIKSFYFDYQKIIDITGINISKECCIAILYKLGFMIKNEIITVPSWRLGNVENMENITEEVIRVYGINKIPYRAMKTFSRFDNQYLYGNKVLKKFDMYRSVLCARQFNEVITWSFINRKFCNLFQLKKYLYIKNPISLDFHIMRPTLLVGMLLVVKKNMIRELDNISIFEIGNVYFIDNAYRPKEAVMIAGIRVGFVISNFLYKKIRIWDFYDIKNDLFSILESSGINTNEISFSTKTPNYYCPGKSALILFKKKIIGYCGQLHPDILTVFDIKIPVACFEIFEKNIIVKSNYYVNDLISDFQIVKRDFSFLVDINYPVLEIVNVISNLKSNLIKDVKITDIYHCDKFPYGKKSVTIHVKIQSDYKTLTDLEIECISTNIINRVLQTTGGLMRKF